MFYVICIVIWGQLAPSELKKNLNYSLGAYGHLYTRINELKTYGHVDVVFLGSSHAYREFDPRIFKQYNINSFNLGSSAQSPVQTEILVNKYLDLLNPAIVIYEVYPGAFSNDGVESSIDLISNDHIDKRIIYMVLRLNHIKLYNTLIYGLFRQCLNLNSRFTEPWQKGEDTYIPGGFVEKRGNGDHPVFSVRSRKWNISPRQSRAFERTLNKLKQKNMEVILIQAPLPRSIYQSYSNNAAIDHYFKLNGTYYNFNDLIEFPGNEYFYDSHHLNQKGVTLFNKKLIDILTHDKLL
jgi:hypothetical protein